MELKISSKTFPGTNKKVIDEVTWNYCPEEI